MFGTKLPGKVSACSHNLPRTMCIPVTFDHHDWFLGRYISIRGNKWQWSLSTSLTHGGTYQIFLIYIEVHNLQYLPTHIKEHQFLFSHPSSKCVVKWKGPLKGKTYLKQMPAVRNWGQVVG
jgi:hypothetical protein